MLSQRVLARALGVDAKSVRVESAELVGDELEIRLRPRTRYRWRCPHCSARCPGYDQRAERRWRALDFGRTKAHVVAQVPRVRCRVHGVVVAGVPWARHGARHTLAFEQLAAWRAVEMSASAASRLLRCTWRTIGGIVARAAAALNDEEVHRAWALKEGLRVAVTSAGPGAIDALDCWISWAQRSRLPSFVRLARRIRDYRTAIVATIEHGLTNALVESFNTKIRLIARRAFGFHHVNALIALARLTLSGQRPVLPT